MELKLNIYNKRKIEKTYTADAYDLMFGTMEDILNIIDVEKLQSSNQADFVSAVGSLLKGGLGELKPLIMDVFEGLTEEELRRTRTKDLVKLVIEILKYSIVEINGVSDGKNA